MSEDFGHLLRVYATKTETHSNTLSARAKKLGKAGRILARMASNLHTASLLLREADARLSAPVQASEARGDWVMVPSTLTLEMYSAWCESNGEGMSFHLVQAQWAAMLATAPISAHTQAGPVG